MNNVIRVIAEGDYAMFSRPEMKVERVSYDVPTPGAMEGMLKQVYWKPAVKLLIKRIVVYNPIKFANVRRNEVKSKVLLSDVKKQMKGVGSPELYASEIRTQRNSMLLKDVKYGIEFTFKMTGIKSEHEDECIEKHYNIMLRRLKNGQHFRAPYFGCKEFPVKRLYLTEEFDLSEVCPQNMGDTDLGYMLYGMDFEDKGQPLNKDWENPVFSDNADAVYYRPHMIDGVIDVEKYKEGLIC